MSSKRVKYNDNNGFKEWYQNVVVKRMNEQSTFDLLLGYDSSADQIILGPSDLRSHIYQYNEYLKNKV